MRTIVLLTQKGGAGKTTLAASLSIAAAAAGERVIALDLDPQNSLMDWAERRSEDNPLPIAIDAIPAQQLPKLRALLEALESEGYTVAILDTPGVNTPATGIAMEAASLCLIPTQPTVIDLAATTPTWESVVRLGKQKSAAFLLNRCPTHTKASRTAEAAQGLKALGVLAEPPITQRTDHQDAIAEGVGVTEYAPAGKAAEEITALWKWINKRTKERR
jgi:chromosome partitioning protein